MNFFWALAELINQLLNARNEQVLRNDGKSELIKSGLSSEALSWCCEMTTKRQLNSERLNCARQLNAARMLNRQTAGFTRAARLNVG